MWEDKKLGEVCLVGDGAHASIKRCETGVLYLTAKNFTSKGLDLSKTEFISEDDYKRHFCKKTDTVLDVKQDDLVFYIIGSAYVVKEKDVFGLSSSVAILRPHKNKISSKFLYYWILSDIFQTYVENIKSGVAQGFLSLGMIKKLPVLCPLLPTQQKIADILSAYDDLIENNNRRIELMEQAAQQLYKEWFVRFRFPGYEKVHFTKGLPDGWEVTKLGSVVKINSKSIDKKYKFHNINYIDISSVEHGNILSKTHYAIEQAPGRAKRIVTDGDVLWSMVRPNLRAYSIILDPEPNDIASTGFAVLTPEKVPFSFLYYLVTDDSFVDYLSNYARGAAYPAVTSAEFENAKLLLPPLELLSEFHLSTEPFFREVSILKQKNQNLIKQRDLLLPRMMSGKLEV